MREFTNLKLKALLEARRKPELTPQEQQFVDDLSERVKRMAQHGIGGDQSPYAVSHWLESIGFVSFPWHEIPTNASLGTRLSSFTANYPQDRRQRKNPQISTMVANVFRDTSNNRHIVTLSYRHPLNKRVRDPERTTDETTIHLWRRPLDYQPPAAEALTEARDFAHEQQVAKALHQLTANAHANEINHFSSELLHIADAHGYQDLDDPIAVIGGAHHVIQPWRGTTSDGYEVILNYDFSNFHQVGQAEDHEYYIVAEAYPPHDPDAHPDERDSRYLGFVRLSPIQPQRNP